MLVLASHLKSEPLVERSRPVLTQDLQAQWLAQRLGARQLGADEL
jgi:hypothetical protein